MVLIFSRVQRCNALGRCYGYKEQFDAPEELAKQLVGANVCQYVVKAAPVKEPAEQPKPEESANVETMPPEAPEVIPENEPEQPKPGKKQRR